MGLQRSFYTLVLLAASSLVAQEYRATIAGLVMDPSGAPITGAQVEVISVERNVSYSGETNESGRYLTRFLPPGQMCIRDSGLAVCMRTAFW